MSSPPFAPGPGRLAWSSSPELGKARGAVLVPTGAVEQHGPHLATGVDIWLATAVALGVAGRDASIRVAEPISYGSSAHHLAFPGTISLRPSTFIAMSLSVRRTVPALVPQRSRGPRAGHVGVVEDLHDHRLALR